MKKKPSRKKAPPAKRRRMTFTITIDAQEMIVSYEPHWMRDVGHFEFESPHEPRRPIPISETGYRSHFAAMEIIEAAANPQDFARAVAIALLQTMAREVANQFQNTYAIGTDVNAQAVKKIFLDHGLSEQNQKELHDGWTAAGIYEANNYSLQQRKSFIMGVKGMAVAENFNIVETFALDNFNVRRQKVARCSSNQ